jgi:DNA polymerase beta
MRAFIEKWISSNFPPLLYGVWYLNIHSLVPQKSKGAALLALTGDNEFWHDVCTRAARHGLLLNEFGLWRWVDVGEGSWELLCSESEEEIMDHIGMAYVPPEKRNFAFLVGS